MYVYREYNYAFTFVYDIIVKLLKGIGTFFFADTDYANISLTSYNVICPEKSILLYYAPYIMEYYLTKILNIYTKM